MRDLLTLVASAVLILLLAAAIGPVFVDWSAWRPEIARRAGEALGLPVRIDGALSVRLLPALSITAQNVAIGGAGAEQASFKMVALQLALTDALTGRLRVLDGQVQDGTLRLDPPTATAGTIPVIAGAAPIIERLDLLNVAVSGSHSPAFRVAEGVLRLPPGGALALEGRFADVFGTAPRGRLTVGEPEPNGVRRARLTAEDATLDARLTLDGVIAPSAVSPSGVSPSGTPQSADRPRFEGTVLVTQLASGAAAAAWRIDAKVAGSAEGWHFEAVEAISEQPYPLRLSGSARLTGGATPELTVDATARRLDVAAWIAALGGPEAALARIGRLPLSGMGWPVRLGLSADAATLGPETIEGVRLDGTWTAGRLIVSRAGGRWTGRGEVNLSGTFDPAAEEPFTGRFDAATGDLAAFAAGLGLSEGGPATQRAQATLRGTFGLARDRLRVDDLRLITAGAVLNGAVSRRVSPTGRDDEVAVTLTAGDLDLTSLPALDLTQALRVRGSGRLLLEVDRLRAGPGPDGVGRLRVSASTRGPRVEIHALEASGFGGAALVGAGRFGGDGAEWRGRIEARALAPFVEIARRFAPGPATEAFAARRAAFEPTLGELTIARDTPARITRLTLAGVAGASRIDARFEAPDASPPFGTLTLEAAEATTLLTQLGLAADAAARLGPGRLTAAIAPATAGSDARLTARLDGGGTVLAIDGAVRTGADAGANGLASGLAGSGAVSLSAQDARRIAAALGWRPPTGPAATAGAFGLDITGGWRLDPAALSVTAIAGQALGSEVTGFAALSRGAAPMIRGEFRVPSLTLAGLFGATGITGITDAAPQAFAAPPLPVTLRLSAPTAQAGLARPLTDVALTWTLDAGGIAITQATARLGAGRVSGGLSARRGRDGVELALDLTGDTLDLADLIGPTAARARISGRIEASGTGPTAAEAVGRMAGAGALSLQGASLPALDTGAPARIYAQSRDDERLLDARPLAAALARELARAGLGPIDAQAPIVVSGGVARATPLTARTGDATLSGAIALDLRRGTLDARLLVSNPPAGTRTDPAAIGVTWRGPALNPVREIDPAPLATVIAVERVRIELDRIEAFEADQRERGAAARRLRAARDGRAREIENERRARELERTHALERANEEEQRRRLDDLVRRSAPPADAPALTMPPLTLPPLNLPLPIQP